MLWRIMLLKDVKVSQHAHMQDHALHVAYLCFVTQTANRVQLMQVLGCHAEKVLHCQKVKMN